MVLLSHCPQSSLIIIYIRNLHDALSGYASANVEETVPYSEHNATKCIGMAIETNSWKCLHYFILYGTSELLPVWLSFVLNNWAAILLPMAEQGWIEIGVRSTYEDVARGTL